MKRKTINLYPKQFEFVKATEKADEILYGGAAGGGKSYGQLVDTLIYAAQYPGSKQLILRRTFPELVKLLEDDEEALTQIYVTRKHIVFLIGEVTFFSRLIDGAYIDYDRIIIENHKISVKANKRELISALERAALVTEEKIAGSVRSYVKLEAEGELLKISAESTIGSTYDELAVEHPENDIVIAFNNRYLMDSVRACDGEYVTLKMSTPLTSMNIEPCYTEEDEEKSDEIFMLLPVRMKEN